MADIHISGLTKRFGATNVLQGLDLTVRDGEFLTLLGSSGCGKSTLLKLIAGLDTPDTGTIRMGGRDLLALSPSQRDCAMVFQSYALYPHMTVLENISMPLVMRSIGFWGRLPGARYVSAQVRHKLAETHASAHDVAKRLSIDGLLDRKPAHLSGGQRQRVALARAMVRHPSVFLFDEPLSNLDANLRQALRAEIRQLHDQLGVTFIYVTHDQHEAMSMSDRVAIMREGRILQLAPPEQLYLCPKTLEVARFVGSPRINVVAGAILPGGQIYGLDQRIGQGPANAGACHLAFRPQAITLGHGPGLAAKGMVTHVEYAGAEILTTLALVGQDEPCIVCVPAGGAVRIGEPLAFTVPWEALHAFEMNGERMSWSPQVDVVHAA
nr:ABC transporter ATP-binding protein [uncultured Albidiferax sp.]